ncbi:hypothetical protein LJC07_07425 [Christensenellaceae bacterium OttesenSCG-928-L17]|nr:hypothetical protein [Christensenellaceae bacterium OttesenSCG-928-L17]
MKKTISIVLVFILVVSMLAGCGSKPEPQETDAPSNTPTALIDPIAPEEPLEISIENESFGGIHLTVEPGRGVAAEVAGQDENSLGALGEEYYGDMSLSTEDMVMYQKAHLHADGVNMVVGYTDYSNDIFKTYENAKYIFRNLTLQEIEYGGMEGYCYVSGTLLLVFPATTQYAARIIALYPDEMPEDNVPSDLDEWLYLLETQWVAEVLDTLEFTGEIQSEAKWSTEPVEVKTFSLTPVDGWEVQSLSSQVCMLKKEGASDWFTSNEGAAQMHIWSWSLSSAAEELEEQLENQLDPLEQLENIVINGREYFLLKAIDENPTMTGYVLITSWGETFAPEEDGYVSIELQYTFDLEAAMPQLENITIK